MSRILIPKGRGRRDEAITGDFNTIEPYDGEDERKAKLEQWIAKQIGTHLVSRYEGREWKVIVDLRNQMLVIACDSICTDKGYHLKMAGRTIHDLQEKAVYAAGEILERHAMERSQRVDPMVFEHADRDFKDNIIGPDTAPEPG
jgi:hypothetical protein